MATTNTRRDQEAAELVRCLREKFRGSNAELSQFSARQLTKKGDKIAAEAEPHMSERELLRIAHRALSAGY